MFLASYKAFNFRTQPSRNWFGGKNQSIFSVSSRTNVRTCVVDVPLKRFATGMSQRRSVPAKRATRPHSSTTSLGVVLPLYIPPKSWTQKLMTLPQRIRAHIRGTFVDRRFIAIFGRKELAEFRNAEKLRQIYMALGEGLVKGSALALRRIMTAEAVENLEELKTERIPGYKYEWRITEFKTPKIMARTMTQIPTPIGQLEFAQYAVKFNSLQVLEVFDAFGKLVAGSSEPKRVVDIWVFETPIKKDTKPVWTIVGKLDESGRTTSGKDAELQQ